MAKKPEEIFIGNNPFYCWKYEEQTKIKHTVFFEYIDCWIKILGKYNRLNYFDCYGGCGAYIDAEKNIFYGSPVETAKIINKNHISLDRNVNLVVIEKDSSVLDNLKKVFESTIPKAKPLFINENFDKAINDLLDELESKGTTLAPTFFFVDPFGYSIKMDTIKRIMKVPKSEVLINFMYNRINISMSNEQEKNNITNLFGTMEWETLIKLDKVEKEETIIKLYRKQTKVFSKYVYAYKLKFPYKDRTYYYLVHLSNHFLGCSIMKSTFAKHNLGRLEFLGQKGDNLSIFDMTEYKIDDIMRYFSSELWANKVFTYSQVIELTIDSTPYTESDIKKSLKTMETSNKIEIQRNESKKDGLKGKDTIKFQENLNGKH